MENAAEKLDLLFGKAERQLNALEERLDQQYTSLEGGQAPAQSAVGTVRALGQLRGELTEVAAAVGGLRAEQRAVMQSMQLELSTLTATVNKLSHLKPADS